MKIMSRQLTVNDFNGGKLHYAMPVPHIETGRPRFNHKLAHITR